VSLFMIRFWYLLDGTKENHEFRLFGLSADVCNQDILNAKQMCYPHSAVLWSYRCPYKQQLFPCTELDDWFL
jgi:hypothetical protein